MLLRKVCTLQQYVAGDMRTVYANNPTLFMYCQYNFLANEMSSDVLVVEAAEEIMKAQQSYLWFMTLMSTPPK